MGSHFGVGVFGAPPILEPILVAGLGCSLGGNRGFEQHQFVARANQRAQGNVQAPGWARWAGTRSAWPHVAEQGKKSQDRPRFVGYRKTNLHFLTVTP